ncbi:protein-glutamate O-methyltransferase [Alteromonadaceae bacterium BrNp21-10]|nr:protein-glutamate O-methyltransferase [Alteromonadaceae bacterium BrNp21-10]
MQNREIKSKDYGLFCNYLEKQCGIVLGENKQYLVQSRLWPLVGKFGFDNLGSLINKVISGHARQLNTAVIDAMTTNETLWFRDVYPYELLADKLLDQLAGRRTPVRIWSAACSSGQEPYSIAMVVKEYLTRKPNAFPGGVQIIGTDISVDMLERCKNATYDNLSLARGLPAERKKKFFQAADNNSMQLIPAIRNMVSFKPINLLDPYSSLGKFDLVFCRNVLIYFSGDIKSKILQKIAAGLQKDGILILGASESISGLSDKFDLNRIERGIFYTKKQ